VKQPNPTPHFDIHASVVRHLGEELITDEVSAIMELVKNSYDADADWVAITISSEGQVPEGRAYAGTVGYITLEDNGVGMDYDDIVGKWLVISLSGKREMKANNQTTAKLRVPLGDKGVGRLSTQRLGRQLELISGVKGGEVWHHLAFDWSDFDSLVPLTQVQLQYSTSPKKASLQGTQLVIAGLTNPDVWRKEAADKFRGQLSQLIFPHKEHRPFAVYLTINGQKHDLDEVSEELQAQAVGRYQFEFGPDKQTGEYQLSITGKIRVGKLRGRENDETRADFERYILTDQGRDFFHFLTDKEANKGNFLTGIVYEDGWLFSFTRKLSFEKDLASKKTALAIANEPKTGQNVANPGKFRGEIDEFDLRGTDLNNSVFTGLREYKNLISNQVGVRVFRDGFGIKPYGFDNNDWLNLGHSQTSGGSFYGLRPNNVIGYVAISMAGNAQLKELTSREGFTDSPYARNFQLIMDRTVREINEILERTRRSYNDYRKMRLEKSTGFKTVAEPVAQMKKASQQARAIESWTRDAEQKFSELSVAVKKQVEKLQNEPLFSHPHEAAALPLLQQVEALVSEGAGQLSKVNAILETAQRWEESAGYIGAKVADLEGQLVQFTELAGLGLTAEALTHDMYVLLDRINAYSDSFNRQLIRSGVPPAVYEFLEYVRSFTRDLRKQLTHLSPSLRFNREKREVFPLAEFVRTLREYYIGRFANGNIDFVIDAPCDFVVQANKGKLTQVFDNLVLNAEYWLREKLKNDPAFVPQIRIEINDPVVRVSDNGFGVAEYLEETLFQPFVTAKPVEVGRGLGLFIVQQLLESMGGDIFLLQERNAQHRRYVFQLDFDAIVKR
jgi:hypothetical protein